MDIVNIAKYFMKGLLFFVISVVISFVFLPLWGFITLLGPIFGSLFAIPVILILAVMLIAYGWVITKISEWIE